MEPLTFTIEPVDIRALSDADSVVLNAFLNRQRAEDRPEDPPIPLEVHRAQWPNIPAHDEVRMWFVRDGDELIATAGASFEPKAEDNRHLLGVEISVAADARQRGIGTALLRELVGLADETSRTLLMGGTSSRIPAGNAFAERVGATKGQEQRVSQLLLDAVDPALIRTWVEEGPVRAADYELVFVDGDIPDELMDGALAAFQVMNTAPRDDLEIEDWKLTAEHIRSWEKLRRASGGQHYTLFVRHRPSGNLVGFTEIGWNPKVPGIVQQMGTAVDPAHRGHALGKWLKADMLRRLFEVTDFDAREVRTGNAESNDAMLGINVALGFKPWLTSIAWQLKVDAARAYLANA